MAAQTAVRAIHKTLSGTVADSVAITGSYRNIEVMNEAAAGGVTLYFTVQPATTGTANNVVPTTAVASADDTIAVPAQSSVLIEEAYHVSWVLSVVGNGNAYSVTGFDK